MGRPLPAAVFASGSGSNLQALLDAERRGAPWRIRLVVSDRDGAGALERGRAAGARAAVIPVSGRDPAAVGEETLGELQRDGVQVVFLAGYLRLVPAAVVQAFRRRMLNVHPALLPAFGGKGMWGRRVHEAVLAAGCRITGPTVHFVDERYDEGTVLAQWPVPVLPGDTPDALAARVLEAEHLLYPLAARHLCRALASGDEAAPFAPAGDAYALAAPAGTAGLAALFQEAFPEP